MNTYARFIRYLMLIPPALLMACGGSGGEDDPGNIEANIIEDWGSTDVSILIDGKEYSDYIRQISAAAGVTLSDADVDGFVEDAETEIYQTTGQIIRFVADGSFISTYSDLGDGAGNWTVSGNTPSLDSGEGPLLYTVENLTDEQLRLSFSGGGTEPTLDLVEDGRLRAVFYFVRI